jgi:hypothetical protein
MLLEQHTATVEADGIKWFGTRIMNCVGAVSVLSTSPYVRAWCNFDHVANESENKANIGVPMRLRTQPGIEPAAQTSMVWSRTVPVDGSGGLHAGCHRRPMCHGSRHPEPPPSHQNQSIASKPIG